MSCDVLLDRLQPHRVIYGRGATFHTTGTSYNIREWRFEVQPESVDVKDFRAGAFEAFLTGFRTCTIRARGPFDPDTPMSPPENPC